jgi:hypothetical protein
MQQHMSKQLNEIKPLALTFGDIIEDEIQRQRLWRRRGVDSCQEHKFK